MARDKITVELELATKRAEREVAALQKQIDALGKGVGKAFSGPGGGDKARALGSGLSKATVKADEFNKSLEASNARVIAFGASAGLIMQVDRALKAMVTSAIKVEKAMKDVAVVMEVSNRQLDKFGKGMFTVAKQTAQSFDTVAEAAVELARQGLGMEQTLSRTKDALILTRLTGMNAADSVKTLTAAVNSFNKEGVTSAQIINRMAKVDAAFAVSSEDLAKSISRVGSSAISAGVSMNELMAITTAVQQKTARGGAVIGNAFKTIFTRIQRASVQKKLKDFGVATTDMSGKMLSGIQVVQNLADKFDMLSRSQQASLGESVAGVFQINILKAAMSDLSSETSNYKKALDTANSATNEAYKRNEQLNQTLDSLVNRTLANLTAAGASLGGGLFEPVIRKVLGTVNVAIDSFGKDGKMEGFGQTIGKGLIAGMANFISGPGLVMAIAVFGKLSLSLAKFASQALKDVLGINVASKQRVALEEAVVTLLKSEPMYLDAVEKGTLDVLKVERLIYNQIKANNLERSKLAAYATPITAALMGRGAAVSKKGTVVTKGAPGGAGGFIPNFASPGGERAAAAAGGYTAGGIRTMNQPGVGSVMYNSAETVKRFPGMSQSAIMPPEGSPAGAGYRAAFGGAHGFDPYAGRGFVPNFAGKTGKTGYIRKGGAFASAPNIGIALGFQGKRGDVGGIYSQRAGDITALRANLHPDTFATPIGLTEVKTRAIYQPGRDETDAQALFEGEMDRAIRGSLGIVARSIVKQLDKDGKPIGAADRAQIRTDVKTKPLKLAPSFEGDLFEEGLRIAIQGSTPESTKAAFDFEAGHPPTELMKRLFGTMPPNSRIDAKRQQSTADNIVNKYFSEGVVTPGQASPKFSTVGQMLEVLDSGIREGQIIGKPIGNFLATAFRKRVPGMAKGKAYKAAGGFVPNFSPLTSAIGREMQAGVPASAIRVGSSPALRGAGNPGGVGVYNTIHEPGGLRQGISRSRLMGVDPQGHGAASGLVPNFAGRIPWNKGNVGFTPAAAKAAGLEFNAAGAKAFREGAKGIEGAGKTMGGAADKFLMGAMFMNMAVSGVGSMGTDPRKSAQTSAWGNVATMGAMGAAMTAGTGPGMLLGALGGAGLGALTSMGDFGMAYGEAGRKADADAFATMADMVTQNINKLTAALTELQQGTKGSTLGKIESLTALYDSYTEIMDDTKNSDNSTVKKIRQKIKDQIDPYALTSGAGVNLSVEDIAAYGKMLEARKLEMQAAVAGKTPFQEYFDKPAFGFQDVGRGYVAKGGEAARAAFPSQIQDAILELPQGRGELEKIRELIAAGEVAAEAEFQKIKSEKPANVRDRYTDRNMLSSVDAARVANVMGPQAREASKRLAQLMIDVSYDIYGDQLMEAVKKAEAAPEKAEKNLLGTITKPSKAQRSARLAQFMLGTFGYAGKPGPTGTKGGYPGVPGFVAPRKPIDIDVEERRRPSRGMVQEYLEGQVSYHKGLAMDAKMGGASRTAGIARQRRDIGVDLQHAQRLLSIQTGGEDQILQRQKLQKANLINLQNLEIEDNLSKKNALVTEQRNLASAAYLETIKKADMGEIEMIRAEEDFRANYDDLNSLTDDELRLRRKSLNSIDARGTMEEAEIAFISKELNNRLKINKTYDKAIEDIVDKYIDLGKSLDKSTKQAIKEYLESQKFQIAFERARIAGAGIKARTTATGLREMRAEGYGITSREIADADKTARRAGIREGTRGGASFGEVFGEVNAYGKTDYMLEFEDGMTSVAETMKSSFADAFKSIASGASSGKGAIVAFADALLNSISNISANMATNMMFSRLFPEKSKGGYIPRFQGGGIVTGGSGLRDDVPAMMEGGEYVIKKSSAQKIGYGTLDAINGGSGGGSIPRYQGGGQTAQPQHSGMDIAKMYGVSAAAGLVAGAINKPKERAKIMSQNYGLGKSELGYLGGADPDVGGGDRITGGRSSAQVSLNKAFVYYRRDPVTGALVSERARPTEGRFETSSLISTMGLLREDDPQTSRMFSKEQKLASYQDYLVTEKKRRKDVLAAHDKMLRGRMIGAYVNAAMLVGGSYFMSGPPTGAEGGGIPGTIASPDLIGPRRADNSFAAGGSVPRFGAGGKTSPALLMGGEYVMSPDAVRTHGASFMSELNRGNVPGGAGGGFFTGGGASLGGGTMAGLTTNNVKININVDKSGKSEVGSSVNQGLPPVNQDERDTNNEIENNKAMGKLLQGVVLKEIVQQQRPGGLLAGSSPYKP